MTMWQRAVRYPPYAGQYGTPKAVCTTSDLVSNYPARGSFLRLDPLVATTQPYQFAQGDPNNLPFTGMGHEQWSAWDAADHVAGVEGLFATAGSARAAWWALVGGWMRVLASNSSPHMRPESMSAMHRRSTGMVLRPSPRLLAPDWRSRLGTVPLVSLACIVVLVVVGFVRDPEPRGWLITAGVVVALFAMPNIARPINARLIVTSTLVLYRGVLCHQKVCARDELKDAERIRIAVIGPRITFDRLLLLDARRNALISIQEEWWSLCDLDAFCARLGVRPNRPATSSL